MGLTLILAWGMTKAQETEISDIMSMSLEELMSLEITSVSKKVERLRDVASAIYVITEEDIRRSGATRLQDLLQMHVPGVFIDFNNYNSVNFGARTQTADSFSGTVLFLVDNVPYQSLYTSSFTFEDFDFDLEEIDRIEVIRGPGGTIYGANAATGIVNIFTKQDQEGWRASARVGSNGYVAPSLRFATNVTEKTNVKVFAKGNFFDGFDPLDEFDGETVTVPVTDLDPLTGAGLGTSSGTTTITNQLGGDVYRTDKIMGGINVNSQLNDQTNLSAHTYYFQHQSGAYIPAISNPINLFLDPNRNNTRLVSSLRLDRSFAENHSIFAQLSFNREKLDGDLGVRATSITNLEIQDNFSLGKHNLNSGITLRSVDFEMGPLLPISGFGFTDERRTEFLWSAFIQDQIRFTDNVDLTLGVKAETWTLIDSRPELSPSLRLSVRPNDKFNIWAAASRSVTTPGYIQTNLEAVLVQAIPNVIPFDVAAINSEGINQSDYLTGEIGVRTSGKNFSLDVTGFYLQSDDLIGTTSIASAPVPAPTDGRLILPVSYANVLKSTNYGVETIIKFFPSTQYRFELSHSFLNVDLEAKEDPFTGQPASFSTPEAPIMPEHIFRFKSYVSFGNDFEFSLMSMYHTETGNTVRFFYDQQRRNNQLLPGDTGVALDGGPSSQFRMDVKLEKFFSNRRSSVFIWANDVFNDGTVLSYSSFKTGIPMQVHRLFGVGGSIKF